MGHFENSRTRSLIGTKTHAGTFSKPWLEWLGAFSRVSLPDTRPGIESGTTGSQKHQLWGLGDAGSSPVRCATYFWLDLLSKASFIVLFRN